MYDWLNTESEQIRWGKFFEFQKNFDPQKFDSIQKSFGPMPTDYIDFVKEFGETRMFRCIPERSYNMGVLALPRLLNLGDDEQTLEVGFYINAGSVCYRKRKSSPDLIDGIFEGDGGRLRKSADSFHEWLEKRYLSSKKLYKKAQWKQILKGAAPFTAEELKIVEAIELFSFENVGVSPEGKVRICIRNGSQLRLPFLTVGVNVPTRLVGTTFLDVSGIGPGETKVIEQEIYKSLASPESVQLFRKSPPEPEDRGFFREFGVS